jgi:hypothetical protein
MPESKFPFRGQGSYDFIFLGAGCATLSIVMRMIRSGKFSDKKILLIDKEKKHKTTGLGVSGKSKMASLNRSFIKNGTPSHF